MGRLCTVTTADVRNVVLVSDCRSAPINSDVLRVSIATALRACTLLRRRVMCRLLPLHL